MYTALCIYFLFDAHNINQNWWINVEWSSCEMYFIQTNFGIARIEATEKKEMHLIYMHNHGHHIGIRWSFKANMQGGNFWRHLLLRSLTLQDAKWSSSSISEISETAIFDGAKSKSFDCASVSDDVKIRYLLSCKAMKWYFRIIHYESESTSYQFQTRQQSFWESIQLSRRAIAMDIVYLKLCPLNEMKLV